MLASTIVNYWFGLLIDGSTEQTRRLRWLTLSITINLVTLCYFKYSIFFVQNLNLLLHDLGIEPIHQPNPVLPAGISFYTFHALSYLIDVFRGHFKAQRNIFNLGLYISFFPQLISGPIIRYEHIAPEISYRTVTISDFSIGIQRFVFGLSKKLLIANAFAPFVDQIFTSPTSDLSTFIAWLGILFYAFQIYFDFSGYSDMAIGLARMFGFHFNENFNYPYIATSITDFWRRWHLSLSSWFRDYLYIPMGGNRFGVIRNYFNLFTVFTLCGLWHGASWNFIVWGLFHGFVLIFEKKFLLNLLTVMPRTIRFFYTWVLILISWVFFRSESIQHSKNYLKAMFMIQNGPNNLNPIGSIMGPETVITICFALTCSTPIFIKKFQLEKNNSLMRMPRTKAIPYYILIISLIILCYSTMAATTFNPFIYYRF